MSINVLTDDEFSTLIQESMIRQARPIISIQDPRVRRWSVKTGTYGLYIGLFQVKDDACACPCEALGQHCAHCVAVERGFTVYYEPTEQDFAQVRGLSSPA